MEKEVFSYLEKDYRYLNNYIREINEVLFTSPHEAIIKGRTFVENLTQEISKLEGYGLLNMLTQAERLRKLTSEGIFTEDIDKLFHSVRLIGNKAAHSNVEGELEAALNIHKNIYRITSWFVEVYVDPNFEALPYKSPMPSLEKASLVNEQTIEEIMKKTMEQFMGKNQSESINDEETEENIDDEIAVGNNIQDIDDAYMGLVAESIVADEPDKKCLVEELSRLKESSKEAVESLGEFTSFKKYMHIVRDAQKNLDELIHKAYESNKAQLILVCGSVGDGKSHIISYFNNKYSDIMNDFTLHNDATESLEPDKTSMDTLNDVLDEFSDEKVENSTQKFILAINLGTLNNFIDSKYGYRFTKLKEFVRDKKILETSIEDSDFDENSSFQFVNFSDYHIFTLKDGKVHSEYVKSLINKITQSYEDDDFTEKNIFYASYKKNCSQCENNLCCPIKANYELLSKENVQDSIVDLLVQCIIKDKIIISTRALLNFMYELIIPRSYIDVNSPTFKSKIMKLNNQHYVKALLPNIVFDHKELSFMFESLNKIDPLNVRNEKVDDFIIEFNNASNIMEYFSKYIDYPKSYIDKVSKIDFNETEDKKLKFELLRLFIRSYYICGKNELFSLRDKDYDEYINALFYWNKGDKVKLKNLYNNVKEGIMKWNGEADKNHINIFMGKNQIKYKASEKIELKPDPSNLPKNDDNDLKKFIGDLKLKFRGVNSDKSYEVDIDYTLYKLLIQVNKGYRPNKKDKNHFIKFIEFINRLEEAGSQSEEIIFTEKNREINKQFKLEFDEEFETYRFVEI